MPKIIKCSFKDCPQPTIIIPESSGTVVVIGHSPTVEKSRKKDHDQGGTDVPEGSTKHQADRPGVSIESATDYLVVYCNENHKNYFFIKDE